MFSVVNRLIRVLDRTQIKRLIGLQLMIILMSLLEVAGVLSIGPFMAVATDVHKIESSSVISRIYDFSGASSSQEFIIFLGVASLALLSLGSILSAITSWRLMRTGEIIGAEISSRLFQHYMNRSWIYHAATSSNRLVKQISIDCVRVTQNIIYPSLQANAKIVLVVMMGVAVFLVSPLVTLVGVLVFVLVYGVIYFFVRRPLSRMGGGVSSLNLRRFKLMSEGFGGIKDVLVLNRQVYFVNNFREASLDAAKAQSNISIISVVPRYVMELVAFGLIISIVMYLVGVKGDEDIIPLLSVIALAGMKLLPAFQYMYMAQAQIKGNMSSFEAVEKDLLSLKESKIDIVDLAREFSGKCITLTERVSLRDVSFTYPGKQVFALNHVNMEFKMNTIIGLVGASGSGKSTTVDLLLGLLRPDEGQLMLDQKPLDDEMIRAWQEHLGYVPQSIFLMDSSIAENIAFGLSSDEIDLDKMTRAARLAHLDEFVNKLPERYATVVGERGVQLSGGQRQRIGIARALYKDPPFLVFDEATSALDGITEKLIMDAINEFSGKKTVVVIAHRLTTVKNCDVIYMLDSGSVVDSGTYDELVAKNEKFKNMTLS